MEFPLLIKASDQYKHLLLKGRRQEVLMSAEYLLEGKGYRVVGTVRKSLFGGIKDYNFLDFVVVDESDTVIKDPVLSSRIYFSYGTVAMLHGAEQQVVNSIHDHPSYFSPAIKKYDEIIRLARPVLKIFKNPEPYYDERFEAFYHFLLEANETNIQGDDLARKINPLLLKAKEHQNMSVKEIEDYRVSINKFFKLMDLRTLLILKNEEVFVIIKLVLDSCRVRKDIDLSEMEQEVKLIQDIIKGCRTAITNTKIKMEMEKKRKVPVEEIISILEVDHQRGTLVDDVSGRKFNKRWLFRNLIGHEKEAVFTKVD